MNRRIRLANNMKNKITDLFLYNQRYLISSIIVGIILFGTLLITGLYAPGGLAQTEIDSTVASHELGFGNLLEPRSLIGLPFKIMQKISIGLFGLSAFSIKLPALITTGLAAIGLFVLIANWTDRRSAILSTIVVLISSRWLVLSQLGNQIPIIISLSMILVSVLTYLTHQANIIHQKRSCSITQKIKLASLLMAIFVISGLLFYFPMGAYLIFIVSLTMILHPFIRLSLKRLNKLIGLHWYFIGLASFVVILTPLVIGVIKNINLATNLLLVNDFNFQIIDNIKFILREFLDFSPTTSTPYATPWFNLSAIVLVIIGVFREARTSYRPRSSIILMWLMSAIVMSLFSQQTGIILFIPLSLSLAMGLDYIVTSWYRIFPRNPVARFVGLIPIIFLLASLVVYNLITYIDAYKYQPNLANQFSNDLKLLQNYLKTNRDRTVLLIASKQNNELKFYEILALQNKNFQIANKFNSAETNLQIATHLGRDSVNDFYIKHVITSHFSNNADRFYVYKNL